MDWLRRKLWKLHDGWQRAAPSHTVTTKPAFGCLGSIKRHGITSLVDARRHREPEPTAPLPPRFVKQEPILEQLVALHPLEKRIFSILPCLFFSCVFVILCFF